MIGFFSPNKIDAIWAMTKNRKERKGKKSVSSRARKRGKKKKNKF